MKKFIYVLLILLFASQVNGQKLKKLGIAFENTTYDFGEVQMWENQPAIFHLSNESKHPISILPLFSETDLEIIYPEELIAPGETATIKAIYYTGGTGPFNRKFPIYFNSSPEAFYLNITGNIKSLSPAAYIQCPQSKPEHSKPKVELFGNVAELISENALPGSTVRIIGLNTKIDLTFVTDDKGEFGSKLPTGNYEILVEHPNYFPGTSMFYLGQKTGYLKLRLEPIPDQPVVAQRDKPSPGNGAQEEIQSTPLNSEHSPPQTNENILGETPKITVVSDESKPEETISRQEYLSSNTSEALPDFNLEETVKTTTKQDETPSENSTTTRNDFPEKLSRKTYTIRVLDEKTLEPISDAEVFVSQTTERKKTNTFQSNHEGIAEMLIEKGDYEVKVNAENYLSGEAFIRSDKDEELIRVMLSPISNLFETIYAEKKKENLENNILEQLSFGTSSFEFADEKQDTPEDKQEQESIESKENSVTEIQTIEIQKPTDIGETFLPQSSSTTAKLDSIQKYLDQLQAEKEKLEETLALAAEELAKKEALLETKEAEIAIQNESIAEKEEILKEKEKTIAQLSEDELDRKTAEPEDPATSSEILSVEDYTANNVLFLIDVSSSMGKENKMELLKESMKSMITVLRDIDRVAIIAYNQRSTIILESLSGDNKMEIFQAIDSLETVGLTYGVTGLQTAYDLLQYYYIGNGNNQIILATDGLFSSANASLTESELNKEVRKQASANGIKLSVIGFGQDEDGQKLMQKLANNGEGQFIQINNPWEAKTVLVEEIKLNSKK